MNKLTQEQQQQILDFYFRCGEHQDIEQGRDLIASSPEAAKLYADLEQSLTELDHVKYEACPDNLVDLTIARLKLAAMSTRTPSTLELLLENERQNLSIQAPEPAYVPQTVNPLITAKLNFLRPMFEILAAAASIAVVAGILFPSLGLARDKYRQVACQDNLRTIGAGFTSFANDNHDRLSSVRVKDGSPWWKIGYQGPEIHSNTRYPFALVKDQYVGGKAFVCRGNKNAQALNCQSSDLEQLYDFPSRNNISYSFMLLCDKTGNPLQLRRRIIAGDLNPVFVSVFDKMPCQQNIYQRMSQFDRLMLNQQLMQSLSTNHRGRGQNVLYCDGSVEYIKDRVVNGDDIFTVEGVNAYTGLESPACDTDIFLAP